MNLLRPNSKTAGTIGTLFSLIVAFTFSGAASSTTTPEVQQALRNATFEVVMKKPEKDPLSYEKPLPLELLPYLERTDDYRSIGTAFSLGNNTYVTAGHVLSAGINSQFGPPSLRDADGKVFAIDRIIKYSVHEDFAMFSVVGDPAPKGLTINRTPTVNSVVSAVGNALGEGVVVRDGLYTSNTPEDQDGRWKWIRFSAPASPGNSGGPLIDSDGDVIGIVIGKSPNENLNYSLPIGRVIDAPDKKAAFDLRYLQQLPYLHGTITRTLKSEFSLPKNWQSFSAAVLHVNDTDNAEARKELLNKFSKTFFPTGAEEVLYDTDYKYDPQLVVQQPDDRWASLLPQFESTDLPGDGYVRVGLTRGVTLFRLHRSNSAADSAFYGDSKQFMDLMLKGLAITRRIGTDAVRVTSLGPAAKDEKYIDKYGRVWQQRLWPLPYLDVYVITMILPTPDGCVGILEYAPSSLLTNVVSITQDVSSLIDVSYWGTLEQWQTYLGQRSLLPPSLAKLRVELKESNSSVMIASDRVSMMLDPSILKVGKKSLLGINLSYGQDSTQLEWRISGTKIFTDAQRRSYVSLTRRQKPAAALKQEYQDDWENLLNRRSPYDAKPNRETAETWVAATVLPVDSTVSGKTSDALAYDLKIAVEDYVSSGEMSNKFSIARKSTKILEKGAGQLVGNVAVSPNSSDSDEVTGLKLSFSTTKQYILAGAGHLSAQLQDPTVDQRGRTFADDLREDLISEEIKASLKEIEIQFNKEIELKDIYAAQNQLQALMSVTNSVNEKYDQIFRYWFDVRGVERERTLWTRALEHNRLPLDTAHNKEVIAAQTALEAFTSPKLSFDAARAKATHQLVIAMIADRNGMVRKIGADQNLTDVAFRPRVLPCPAITQNRSDSERLSSTQPSARSKKEGEVEVVVDASNAVKTMARIRPPVPDPDALYPARSKNEGEAGVVVVRLNIDAKGCPTGFAVTGSSGSDALDNAALEFVELLSYYPATVNGNAVSTTQPLAVVFQLR